jgi:hypothetical protein
MKMQLGAEEYAILEEGARRRGIAVEALALALEDESTDKLALALGISVDEAAARLGPVRRSVAVNDDWGAGCRLMTDEVCAELHTALRRLVQPTDHSASSGVSQG